MSTALQDHPYWKSKALRSFLSIDETALDTHTVVALLAFFGDLEVQTYGDGDIVFSEGDPGDAFYLIDSGNAEVWQDSEGGVLINRLSEGDYFGELALLNADPRAATIRARGELKAFRLSREQFRELTQLFPQVFGGIFKKLYGQLKLSFLHLEEKNKQLRQSLKTRAELGFIFISTVVIVSIYAFVIRIFHTESMQGAQADGLNYFINRAIELFALGTIIAIIVKSKLPLSSFGVTFRRSKRAIAEGLAVSAVVIVAMTAVKWWMLDRGIIAFEHRQVLVFSLLDWTYLTYALVVPLQEFIARGVVQSSIHRLLTGKYSGFWAVMVTSLIFGAMHLHSSIALGLAALFSSWLWGWMYTRHHNLIGVSLSHFLISNWAGLLGFWLYL